MTSLAKFQRTASVTPLLSTSLGSQELAKHRAMVGFELEVLAKQVDRFGWDRDRGTPAHDRVMMDWMDALQDYPLAEVKAACQASVLAYPNKMPNYGHVKAQIIAARQKAVAAQLKPAPVAATREPLSEEQKAIADQLTSQFTRRAGVAQ